MSSRSNEFFLHRAEDRGSFGNDWLQSAFSFSFADYFDPNKMGFGVLRVINDDVIKGKSGFPLHPHRNMEIITIPLRGSLEHRDSTGGASVLTVGEVQLMSAGSGIRHSEMNPSPDEDVELFQIWIVPDRQNTAPGYQTQRLDLHKPGLVTIASPEGKGCLLIHQNAYLSSANLAKGERLEIAKRDPNHGVYVLVIEGNVVIDNYNLERRDALGIVGSGSIEILAEMGSALLIFEVPMSA